MTTTAKIASKGCNGTGVTEDLAHTLHNQLGRKVLAVVELVAETRSEKRNGDESVSLSILTLEPAPNGMTEDHLRELARSFHYERQLAGGQLTIETGDDLEPKVADVLAAGERHRPHPFLPANAADDHGICEVCGVVEDGTPLHADRTGMADPFATTTEPDEDDPDEPEDGADNEDLEDDPQDPAA